MWLVCLSIVALVGVALYRLLARPALPPGTRPLPGPKGLPLIGRVHDIPNDLSWLKFYEWSKTYGPIYQMETFGTVHIWISTEKIAHDLLSKRANIYSDRPYIPNLPDNRTSGDYLALMSRNDIWKRQRRLCQSLMNSSASASLHDYPTMERNRFLYLMMQNPDNYLEWVEQFTSRTISRLSWGSPHSAQTLRKTTFGLLETISPAGALPNIISCLAHVPQFLSPWKQKEKARHKLEEKLLAGNVDYVKRMMDEGQAEPSFTRSFFQTKSVETLTVNDITDATHTVGIMAIAGALTIGSPIQSYILAMCHYPLWQVRLRGEIEKTLGGRCPEWKDREKLPLLRAVVKEVMRWRPPVPTGIPHALEKDDVYEGYHIPAGATIHALEWGMTRDESIYPEPETFNPDRWLLPHYPTYRTPLTLHPNLSGYSQFGFGRRTCQGLPIVEQDLFLTMGGLAWAFDIRKKRDKDGMEIPVHWDHYTPLLIAKPVRFPFDAVVHDACRAQAITDLFVEADTVNDGDSTVDLADNVEDLDFKELRAQADGDGEGEYFLGGGESPPMSPDGSRVGAREMEMEQVDKTRSSAGAGGHGPWQHNVILRTQGPIVIR